MPRIQLNEKGSRFLEVTEENFQTIQRYNLFSGIVDSTGYIDETVLNKLRLTIRSLIANAEENTKDLLDLCIDVIYHDSMKPYGLRELINAYHEWQTSNAPTENPASAN